MEQAEQSFSSADAVSCRGFSLSTALDCNRREILSVDGLAQEEGDGGFDLEVELLVHDAREVMHLWDILTQNCIARKAATNDTIILNLLNYSKSILMTLLS
jgi:hypothetical protein